jgi:hypothetical protein
MTTWRYQPVFEEQDGIRSYSLCEVYFDEDGTLSTWTQTPVMAPSGEELGELTDDLVFMIADSFSWEPVRFSELKVGMTFEPKISLEERRKLTSVIRPTVPGSEK